MAFFSDFPVPWWAQGRYSHPSTQMYQDPYYFEHTPAAAEFFPSRSSRHAWPDSDYAPHRYNRYVPPNWQDRHPDNVRQPYEQDMYRGQPQYSASASRPTIHPQHQNRERVAQQARHAPLQAGYGRQYPDDFEAVYRSQQPHAAAHPIQLEELFGLPSSSRLAKHRAAPSVRAGSPTVWSVQSLGHLDNDAVVGNEEDDEEDELAWPDVLLDRQQQANKRQQLYDIYARQQLLREHQQQALQEQKRREALIERELQAQRELQRRRAAEHQLEQQQQEALLAALQQQRRQQQQKLREQEVRLAQQQQAEQQAELERRMQQLWRAHLKQQSQHREAGRKLEAAGAQEAETEDALEHTFKQQEAQHAQQQQQVRPQPVMQQAQRGQAAQRAQQAQSDQVLQRAQQRKSQQQKQPQHADHQAFATQRAQQPSRDQQAHSATHQSHAIPDQFKRSPPKRAQRICLSPDEAAVSIQRHYKGYRVRSEKPMLRALAKANHELTNIFSRLYQVESCITALQARAQPKAKQGGAVKLRHHHGKCGSPEQLQKQLVDLSELSMRVVLSMDELHSDKSEIRMVRKQVVKKALALMERIDNVRAGMLRSLLDTSHPHDSRANPNTPKDPSGQQTHVKMPDAQNPDTVAEGKHADANLTADSPTDTNAIESLAGSTSLDPSAVTLTGKPNIVEGDQSGVKQLSEDAAGVAGLTVNGLPGAPNIHDKQDADKSASEPGEEDGTVQDIDESTVDTAE